MMIATVSFAQNNLVATLTHGDEIKMFYGANALQNAHAAATDGDAINLSGGKFIPVNITKAITLRGTGVNDVNPTYINGSFNIGIPSDVKERLSIEGCYISNTITITKTLTNAYFQKNYIYGINVSSSNVNLENCMFVNCRITQSMTLYGISSVQFINSHISTFRNNNSNYASASFVNCVLYATSRDFGNIANSNLVNCILYGSSDNVLPSSASTINCVATNGTTLFRNVAYQQNCSYVDMTIFKNSNALSDLTDEAKAKYIGNDGTPIGMYGGVFPYNMTPSYPRITKMNVANKTTADGKLSVEIEVSAAK